MGFYENLVKSLLQAIEIEKLKIELKRKDMVIEVLKKTQKYKNVWKEILASQARGQIRNDK